MINTVEDAQAYATTRMKEIHEACKISKKEFNIAEAVSRICQELLKQHNFAVIPDEDVIQACPQFRGRPVKGVTLDREGVIWHVY